MRTNEGIRFTLSANFEGNNYSVEDEFHYRGRKISIKEFEAIRDKITIIKNRQTSKKQNI